MKELTSEQESLIGDDAYHEKKLRRLTTKELDKCYDWWKSLTEEGQLKIMMDYYPTEVREDTNIDKMFGDMPDYAQLWIYRRETKQKTIPVNPKRFNQILIKIGRKKHEPNTIGQRIIKNKRPKCKTGA